MLHKEGPTRRTAKRYKRKRGIRAGDKQMGGVIEFLKYIFSFSLEAVIHVDNKYRANNVPP